MKVRDRIAWNLRKFRSEKGISQENLAVDADVDRTTVSGLENASFNASVDLMERVAIALGVDVAAFFEIPPPNVRPPQQLKSGRKAGK